MTALETGTELFDLFGQEGSCSICMDDLDEGQRVRAVRGCQHLFHAACVEPWLLSHGTCPMCRSHAVAIQTAPAALSSTVEALQTLQAAVQGIQVGTQPNQIQGILAEIEILLGQTQGNLETRRRLLTFAVGRGIQSRFPNAAAFNAVKVPLEAALGNFQFEGIAPYHLSCNNFTVFKESVRSYASGHDMRGTYPDLVALQGRLRGARAASQFLQDFWRAD
jgi:hypothetical protein